MSSASCDDDEERRATRLRALLFWTVCLSVRVGVASLALSRAIPLPLLGVGFGAVAAGFGWNVVEHASGRASPYGGLGGVRWWTRTRVLHFGLWTVAAAFAFVDDTRAGHALFADAALGAFVGLLHYALGLPRL